MKQAAFEGIGDLHNYDLRSSQGYALLQELRLASIDATWLEAHLGPGAFEGHARSIGISKAVYKKCFFSTIMGAPFGWYRKGVFRKALLKFTKGDWNSARAIWKQLKAKLMPLKELVSQWQEWLIGSTECPHRKKTQRREHLLNACGQVYIIDRKDKTKGIRKVKSEAAAFMLQGQEAAYIHHLTLLGKSHGFSAISNQHDGLITIGIVPQSAQAVAATKSGFGLEYAFLEEKPFL